MTKNFQICVCVCTFKRPELLRRLLLNLENQETGGLFDYSVVIVDNDSSESARLTAETISTQSSFSISYFVEPEQNIALARNKAVENSKGDFLAFIDDDEFPTQDWLLTLYQACKHYKADGTLGPVRPYFNENCPSWIEKSKLCERRSHLTGTVLRATETRTGNVLMKRDIFDDPENRFDPQFGRTGGEDVWFFVKVIGMGRVFVWCEEAPVYEVVSEERWGAAFYLRRAIRIGGLTGEEVKTKGLPGRKMFIVFAQTSVYLLITPIVGLFGKHLLMRYLYKIAYNIAYVLGYLGFVFIKNRDESIAQAET